MALSSVISIFAAEKVITNGVPWYDTDGDIINAHGACIAEDGSKYWLFGEYKSDESNVYFRGENETTHLNDKGHNAEQ